MIQELMGKELPNLIDERRFRRREQPRDEVERDEFGRVSLPVFRQHLSVVIDTFEAQVARGQDSDRPRAY